MYDTILAGQSVSESIVKEEESVVGAKIIELLTASAEKGNALAQEYLGECYFHGYGVEENMGLAFKWLQTAGREGIITSRAGECHGDWSDLKCKEEEYRETIKQIRVEAEYGNAVAQGFLGECYYGGYGIEQDFKEAIRWFRLAAEQGNMMAQECLGECYFSGLGVKKDRGEAIRWFTIAAENGNPLAQVMLAKEYYIGCDALEANHEKAVKWFLEAASHGNIIAQAELGRCLCLGDGIEKNCESGIDWLSMAAVYGNCLIAYLYLGDFYFQGNVLGKDLQQAKKWYSMAAGQGSEVAKKRLEEIGKIENKELSERLDEYFDNTYFIENVALYEQTDDKTGAQEVEENSNQTEERRGGSGFLLLGTAVNILAIISGIVQWYLEIPFGMCLIIVAIMGIIGGIAIAYGLDYLWGKGFRRKILLSVLFDVFITVGIILIIKAISWFIYFIK